MANNTPGVTTLQSIVKDYLVERGEFNVENWKRYLQIAIRGFVNLNLTSLNSSQVLYATPNSVGQVFMPGDFIDWLKVGYKRGEKYYILNINKGLSINQNIENGDIINENIIDSAPDSFPVAYSYFVDHYCNDIYLHGIHGDCSQINELAFNVGYNPPCIQFSSMVPRSEMIIEYKASGINIEGNTYVPIYCREPVIEWLYWRTEKANPKSMAAVQMNKQDFEEAMNVMKDIQDLPSYAEVMNALYSNVR